MSPFARIRSPRVGPALVLASLVTVPACQYSSPATRPLDAAPPEVIARGQMPAAAVQQAGGTQPVPMYLSPGPIAPSGPGPVAAQPPAPLAPPHAGEFRPRAQPVPAAAPYSLFGSGARPVPTPTPAGKSYWGAAASPAASEEGNRDEWGRAIAKPDDGFAWRHLPRLLGDFGDNKTGGSLFGEIAGGAGENRALVRSSGADLNGLPATSNLVALEGRLGQDTSAGITTGVLTAGGTSIGTSPTLYAKQVLYGTESTLAGVGFGGALPVSENSQGAAIPWLFHAHRVGENAWLQGTAGLSIPFTRGADLRGYFDYGVVIPLFRRGQGADAYQVYLIPELHGNFIVSRGTGSFVNDGYLGRSISDSTFGNPNFVLNSTIGVGVRYRSFDVQCGMAFPLLSQRFYDYESIVRISYRF